MSTWSVSVTLLTGFCPCAYIWSLSDGPATCLRYLVLDDGRSVGLDANPVIGNTLHSVSRLLLHKDNSVDHTLSRLYMDRKK